MIESQVHRVLLHPANVSLGDGELQTIDVQHVAEEVEALDLTEVGELHHGACCRWLRRGCTQPHHPLRSQQTEVCTVMCIKLGLCRPRLVGHPGRLRLRE